MAIVPVVTENLGKNRTNTCDIFSHLLKDRIIFLDSVITGKEASSIIAQFLYLQLESQEEQIKFYIMSPGGEVQAGLAIYDTMQHVANEIETYCVGQAMSMGALLLSAGTKGKRFSLPSSRIMIHQPWGGVHGDTKDLEIGTAEYKKYRKLINTALSKHTGKAIKVIEKDTERDFFMSPNEAKKYGLIDKVLN